MSNFHFDLSLKLSQGEVHDFLSEVQKFSGEVQNDLRRGAQLPTPSLKIRPCIRYRTKLHAQYSFIQAHLFLVIIVLYYIILYCKLYWTVKQDIPNGTSANGTRSPMRGTLPFYKLIKLQNYCYDYYTTTKINICQLHV